MQIANLDHLVLTVADIEASCTFYSRVLGMKIVTFGNGRKSLHFGSQKINLHQTGQEFEPKAQHPQPGSADICLITAVPLTHAIAHIQSCGVKIIAGPVPRTGAASPLQSIYLRDPDGNLLEISVSL